MATKFIKRLWRIWSMWKKKRILGVVYLRPGDQVEMTKVIEFGCSTKRQLKPSVCSPGKPAKSRAFADLRTICFCVFCLVGLKICFLGIGGVRKNELLAKG